jgi:NitT/TauT family transport system ATP-binding protein
MSDKPNSEDTPAATSPVEKPKAPVAQPMPPKDTAASPSTPVPASSAPASASESLPELVRFDKVTKSFGEGPDARIAVQDVSFVIHDLPNTGELITIVGPSGCGKSTVLRMLAGLRPHFPPTSGEVKVFGKPVMQPGADRGMVDQKYSLMPHLTVRDNISFGLMLRGVERKERCARAGEWAKKVGLDGCEDKYPSELSGGMQQRVSIAATLILEPKILLMDEPFGALDPKIRMQMQELLVQLWKEQQSTVFLVTHSVEEAVYLGDRVMRMAARPGRLVEVLQAPRPDVPPETMRKQHWFSEICQELLHRLETDAPPSGELPGIEKWRGSKQS